MHVTEMHVAARSGARGSIYSSQFEASYFALCLIIPVVSKRQR